MGKDASFVNGLWFKCLKSFRRNPLTLQHTGFLTLTPKLFSSFVGNLTVMMDYVGYFLAIFAPHLGHFL